MENPTLAQGNEIFNLILRNKVSRETVQFLLESGMMANLLKIPTEKFSGRSHELAYRIAQARFQMSLGLLPDFEIVHQYYLDFVRPYPLPSKSLNEMFEERGVKIETHGKKEWGSMEIQGHMIKRRSAEFSLIKFPLFSRNNEPAFDPQVVLNAAGYINADVYDLVAFSSLPDLHLKTAQPVVALKSISQTSTSSTGGGFIYYAHPTLHGDTQKKEVWFDRMGLISPHYWVRDYLCLVRNRDDLARSPKI